MDKNKCYHCGNEVTTFNRIDFDDKEFCCNGCKTVYEIFSENDLSCYYDMEATPGATPEEANGKYDFLEKTEIINKLLEFNEGSTNIVSLYIPHIHCSSCIWILENLHRLNDGVIRVLVNFPEKKATITFNSEKVSLKELVLLLTKIGYEPYISLKNYEDKPQAIDRSLIYKIGIAFFSFGNVMMLSFPEYFNIDDIWMREYKDFFRWLILLISLPVFFYSASPYHLAAWKGIKTKNYTIDIPMSLGIIVMFIRSTIDIIFDLGPGFFDSMTMLVFFMLLGKLFQQRTYNFLSFERDYKSYFPIAITKIGEDGVEEPIQVYEVVKGDRLLIRNQELVPVDSILISESAFIDYSFVTGEAVPVEKKSGDKVFAGGKQVGDVIEIEAVNTVSQSYLTQLWSNDVFQKKVDIKYKTITDTISHYFTPVLLLISISAFIGWAFVDINAAFNVFTAILIVACPCALALTAPFTLGNAIRIYGRNKFYLKNVTVVEQMAKVNTIVFDKTGTITTNASSTIQYVGEELSKEEQGDIRNIIRASNHPLSRKLYNFLSTKVVVKPELFEEIPGKGLLGTINKNSYVIGSPSLLGIQSEQVLNETSVHIQINGEYKGKFVFANHYREGVTELFDNLTNIGYKLAILSGDNDGEKEVLEKLLPSSTSLVFNQKPEEKLEYVKRLQENGGNVMMVGDGLNDAGALAQSNVGVSVSENVNVFTPASDAILDAKMFKSLKSFLNYSKKSVKIIKLSYILALSYNVIGITVSIMNKMSPLVAAILMPISTVSIISFVTIMSNYFAKKIIKKD
ncbi:heavy metal translocating P-type ATPase metal-binding domain-containing protein [Myroides odoratimimus]|uniref:heavy metal translocating P-type ATPase n=1 Tax=Myroides odoratimimus TaxID=76832 RepID=UPI000352811F|nr:heavy metal translocating P-type ATPase metal-binding domain-containing protein [Myroides odoratimimus]EPH11504.1 Cu2+-exporting ATPase [Myroides odoratimimus CCUG 12700]MDM1499828.1 heavy metal translocating P-type ATPase metal-binding domain-containing protein [Myroides odoratimimus]MDM1507168.1 heavy metal translocating P-type ATPase metal-binding domain-containing protein [Myroides odoratimimus]MDM1513877.1 heavy metal translocating P-type ATPase metal-binding domain-containing protein [